MKTSNILLFLNIFILALTSCSSTNTSPKSNSVVAQYERSMEAYKAGRFSDAEPMLRKLLAQYPHFAEGWYRLGNLYVRSGQNEAALTAFKECLRYDSNFTKAWHNLSLVHLKIAISVLDEGIVQAKPNSPEYNQLVQLKLSMLTVGAENIKEVNDLTDVLKK